MQEFRDYYSILNIPQSSTIEEIQKSLNERTRECIARSTTANIEHRQNAERQLQIHRVQRVVATLACRAKDSSSSRDSAGVLHARVLRGRLLRVAATASSSRSEYLPMFVPLGKY